MTPTTASNTHDPSSQANITAFRTRHIALDIALDFARKVVHGTATIDLARLDANAQTVELDTRELTIASVKLNGVAELAFVTGDAHAVFGSKLTITLLAEHATLQDFKLVIAYETSATSSACQWLAPEQTAGKQHPYFFTQCQAIHARSLLPCQDAPGMKAPYSGKVTVAKGLVALMSALPTGDAVSADGQSTTFSFDQPNPIPSYLIAIAAGHLVSVEVGPRSRVWSEPETVQAGAFEFAETEQQLATAEDLLGPYVWGRYDVLLLPPSFPYGGMENPNITFVTPTLLAGDRSLADVVAHEIAHSWTGNLVTSRTWEHFWLNEGFTVYVERKIVGRMRTEQHRHFSAIIGWKALRDSIDNYPADSLLTALVPSLDGVDPDDAFSSVPYEKGFNLLFYLETLLGGPEPMERYLKAHCTQFAFKAVTTAEWKDFFLSFFAEEAKRGVFDAVDWNAWFYTPGMPKPEPKFDQTLAERSAALAARWTQADASSNYAGFSVDDIADFASPQRVVFLEKLLLENPLSEQTLDKMDATYDFTASRNSEIRFRWQSLCLRASYTKIFPHVVDFVTSQGRMKFVRPLYRALFNCDKAGDLAVTTFQKHRHIYHNICASMVAKDLKQ
ncbi:leukotriene A4 hydrolase [Capsaspora owczarzaki ATCC 30864]|uniref:Leukotriene A(4) hydrolase n=2 Tax=Capsaspora owczarzaki (strain ATCC 30864) TaxID=595528 RepID=A0A0D2WNP2_CAPO3|nr:leukotriene A4 hydrolase [Capsaspora owczarzaki ATCC 30864]